jgi:DNA ligase-1
MRAFARLLDQLAFTAGAQRQAHFAARLSVHAPDPERGWALASLTGALSFDAAKPGFIRKAAEARLDPQRVRALL